MIESETSERIEALVRRAQEGEEGAFEELATLSYRKVRRWALVRTGDPDDADDVTQTVLIRLHRSLRDFHGRSAFFSWLYRVTANAAGELQRKRLAESRRRLRLLQVAGEEGHGAPSPTTRVEEREGADLVSLFFDALPPRQREVFDLVDLQGFTPVEVAELLSMNPNTVRAHLLKARRNLRSRLLRRCPELRAERS